MASKSSTAKCSEFHVHMHASGIGLQNSSWTNTRAGLSRQVNCFWQYNHNPPLPWITKQSWFSTPSLQIPFLLSSVRDLLFTALMLHPVNLLSLSWETSCISVTIFYLFIYLIICKKFFYLFIFIFAGIALFISTQVVVICRGNMYIGLPFVWPLPKEKTVFRFLWFWWAV